MATITNIGASPLEKEAINLRKDQTGRSDYNAANEYSEEHPDALADGGKGRGTGDFGGHGWIRPDSSKPKGQMSGMFNSDNAGNECDQTLRSVMTGRSLYGPGREYGECSVDTTANRLAGQYDGSEPKRIPWSCPVI